MERKDRTAADRVMRRAARTRRGLLILAAAAGVVIFWTIAAARHDMTSVVRSLCVLLFAVLVRKSYELWRDRDEPRWATVGTFVVGSSLVAVVWDDAVPLNARLLLLSLMFINLTQTSPRDRRRRAAR